MKLTRSSSRRLFGWWEQEVVGRRHAPSEIIPLMKKRFSTGSGVRRTPDDDLYTTGVRRHIRIGDLLRLRGHSTEAVMEYERALELNEVAVPDITDRLAGCLIEMSRFDQAVDLLSPLLKLYPFHGTLHFQLGSAKRRQGRTAEALQAFRTTINVDPFHPGVHCELQTLYQEMGAANEARLEETHCRMIR
jgi:tetratricopeptide (TPR) repeat protein